MKVRAGVVTTSQCQIQDGGPRDGARIAKNATLATWAAQPEAEWTIHSPKSMGAGKDLVTTCKIMPTVGFDSPQTPATPGGDITADVPLQRPVVKCDTSPLIKNYTGGCVLADVAPVLAFDAVKNDGVKESAKHVWDAYFNADKWTKPESDNPKKVPGHAPYGPLHREVEGANADLVDPDLAPTGTIKKNRTHSISICRTEWPVVRPKEEKLDCDEFPFASTKEGSLSANGNFSVRYINASDNRSSGSQLGGFYQQTRRLGNDPFYVAANPRAQDRDLPPVR
ncbi:hypothetical protein Aph01nite_22160 [Acrocarpospora phusangensis]|uniref:Deoxyribonuclease NucA/NucB domain-containing protein n=1 Tax=Acrocarpospora phusangensis TaxID=1070424 RepID=A0A919Q818_9ACTN|nr:NucA/NucB deoxyribonuclease domain-containing protein [Acrocarpospora phusangensis]GIH23906.1 hypothetical protein Aph01nite_22160 [Acrocarpospora phusangensis]